MRSIILKNLLLIISILYFQPIYGEVVDRPNEFTERILLMRISEGDIIKEDLIAHEIDRILYVSATDFLEALGFETVTSIELGEFIAKIVNPSLEYKILWQKCTIVTNDKGKDFDCYDLKFNNGELFLSKNFVFKFLKIEIEYLPFKSEVRIFTENKFPAIEKITRNKKRNTPYDGNAFDPGFNKVQSKDQTLKIFFLDQQIGYRNSNITGEGLEYYANATTDVRRHEVQLTTQGNEDENEFTTWLVRRDYYGENKNPYISTYQLGNVVLPSAEIIGGPSGDVGLYVSNRPQQQLTSFGQREIEGNLRPGWDVELYISDIFFERQSANELGRYRFVNVPLLYGIN